MVSKVLKSTSILTKSSLSHRFWKLITLYFWFLLNCRQSLTRLKPTNSSCTLSHFIDFFLISNFLVHDFVYTFIVYWIKIVLFDVKVWRFAINKLRVMFSFYLKVFINRFLNLNSWPKTVHCWVMINSCSSKFEWTFCLRSNCKLIPWT
jgi:hypothetical protein